MSVHLNVLCDGYYYSYKIQQEKNYYVVNLLIFKGSEKSEGGNKVDRSTNENNQKAGVQKQIIRDNNTREKHNNKDQKINSGSKINQGKPT